MQPKGKQASTRPRDWGVKIYSSHPLSLVRRFDRSQSRLSIVADSETGSKEMALIIEFNGPNTTTSLYLKNIQFYIFSLITKSSLT
jgi:hypothetical protein